MASVMVDFSFRVMKVDDLNDVMGNERQAYSHPWTAGIFADCIRSGYECWVLLREGVIVGHGILSVAVGDAHILNVCVSPVLQGSGLGRALVRHLLDMAQQHEAERVFLEVRPSNLVAYNLYESIGFNEIGVRRGYYPAANGREDALVLARELFADESFGPVDRET